MRYPASNHVSGSRESVAAVVGRDQYGCQQLSGLSSILGGVNRGATEIFHVGQDGCLG